MRRPRLIVANVFANGRKCLTEQHFPLPLHRVFALGPSAPRRMPHTGWIQPDACCQSSKGVFFMAGFGVNFAWVPDNTAFCFSMSPTTKSKLRTSRPMRLRVLGLGDDMMSPNARWC